jgi:hypothetical protein
MQPAKACKLINAIYDPCPLRGKIYYEKWEIRDEKGGGQETTAEINI